MLNFIGQLSFLLKIKYFNIKIKSIKFKELFLFLLAKIVCYYIKKIKKHSLINICIHKN